MNPQQVRRAIAEKATAEGIDVSSPHNAFIVAKFTPQAQTHGPLLWTFGDLNEAQLCAERQPGDVYLMSTNPQHGLQKVEGKELLFVDAGAVL
jgi:hypothetical protein